MSFGALGILCLRRHGRLSAWPVASVAFSHWLLDLLVHRADMPLLPGNAGALPRLGFALWKWPWLVIALELGFIVLGSAMYWRAAERVCRKGGAPRSRALLASVSMLGVGLLTLVLNAAGN